MGVRELGHFAECVHAPVYFAPEAQHAYAVLGLRGYWRGYFASRAAALGIPSASEVTTRFGGFAPAIVARAIPEVWSLADRADVLEARHSSAVTALARLQLGVEQARLTEAARGLATLVDRIEVATRPMAAAHASLPRPTDALGSLWRDCTILREYRGDAHLAALAEAGLTWPQPHLLLASLGRLDERQREYRGWTEEEWRAAADHLDHRGLLGTPATAALVERLEQATDAAVALGIDSDEATAVAVSLEPLALLATAELPFPNAIGLPRPASAPT